MTRFSPIRDSRRPLGQADDKFDNLDVFEGRRAKKSAIYDFVNAEAVIKSEKQGLFLRAITIPELEQKKTKGTKINWEGCQSGVFVSFVTFGEIWFF